MPRTADHTARRAQIADALVRVAARDGLHAATMRSVAAEAEVSLRLVQYYFHTKTGLLLGALQHLEQQTRSRWDQRLAGLPAPIPQRAFVEAFLAEALPTDEPSRTFHLVGTSYAMLALTDPDLEAPPFAARIAHLRQQLTDALSHAADIGELAPGIDPHLEASRLVALANGLGTGLLAGHHTSDTAEQLLRYHLDQLFPSPPGAVK
ncbi:TetR/AcrR family transcriptional regulator [Nocardia sp. NPDC050193]